MKKVALMLLSGLLFMGCGSDGTNTDPDTNSTEETIIDQDTENTSDTTGNSGVTDIAGIWQDYHHVCGDVVWMDQEHNFSNGSYTTTITEYYAWDPICTNKEVQHTIVGTYTLGNTITTQYHGYTAREIDINVTKLYGTLFNQNDVNYYNQSASCTEDGNWSVGVAKEVTNCEQYNADYGIVLAGLTGNSGFTPMVYKDIYMIKDANLTFGAYPGSLATRPTEINTLFKYPKIQ